MRTGLVSLPKTPTTSKCCGSFAAYWPPVTGTAAAAPALAGFADPDQAALV